MNVVECDREILQKRLVRGLAMGESAASARHYQQRRYRETDAHSHCTFLRNRRQALPEERSSPDSCLSLRRERSLGTKPFPTQGAESEVDVATALTRARQARLPSPWTGRGNGPGIKKSQTRRMTAKVFTGHDTSGLRPSWCGGVSACRSLASCATATALLSSNRRYPAEPM